MEAFLWNICFFFCSDPWQSVVVCQEFAQRFSPLWNLGEDKKSLFFLFGEDLKHAGNVLKTAKRSTFVQHLLLWKLTWHWKIHHRFQQEIHLQMLGFSIVILDLRGLTIQRHVHPFWGCGSSSPTSRERPHNLPWAGEIPHQKLQKKVGDGGG